MGTSSSRLSSPGEHAARARVEAVYEAVDRLSPADLNAIAPPPIDLEARDARLSELERLADGAGRGALLEDARGALANAVIARLADIRPYPDGLYARGTARPEDQAAIVTALRDLVAVAVMQDRLEPDDSRALARPGLHVLGSRIRVLDDPVWADLAGPGEATVTAAAPPEGAPTEAEWTAAADQARAADREDAADGGYTPPGTRLMRRGFFGIVAVAGVIGAVAWGLGEDSLLIALLVAAAVVALCWTFATWSPRPR